MMKNLMLIDTDAGYDDVFAILLALALRAAWEVVAITCVFGDTNVETACSNVLKVLKLYNAGQIPVYSGCDGAFVFRESLPKFELFDEDGIGRSYSSSGLRIARGHAANALVHFARQHRHENIHLVALGPMTNVAMAHRLDSNFTNNLKSISFMGGNILGFGNTFSAAEFNFYADPESAHVMLREAKCPVTMIPLETTLKYPMPWSTYEYLREKDTAKGEFLRLITVSKAKLNIARGKPGIEIYDFLAMASLVEPNCIKERISYPVSVETQGKYTRGESIVETVWNATKNGPAKDIDIITEFDALKLNALQKLMIDD